jgi:hypothetical protein
MTKPFIGMIVEYRYRPNDEPLPAVVNKVHDDKWVGACILGPGVVRFVTHIERDVTWKEIEQPKANVPGWAEGLVY